MKFTLLPALLVFCIGCNVSSDSAKRNYLAKGDRLYASGKYADAVLNYKKAIRKDATFSDAYYKLGLAEIARQSYRDAFQAFYRASELDPANTDAKIKLADLALSFYLSDAQHPKFLYEQFTKVARELLKKQPKSYDALRLNGELARVEKDIKGASDFFRRANEVKPMQPELILSYTQVLFLDGRLAEGEKLALELMEKNKNFGAIYDVLATHYIAAKRMGDAENILKAKVANNARNPGFVLQLAWFYRQSKRDPEMKAMLQRLLKKEDFPEGYLYVGNFYARIGMWDEAAPYYTEGAAQSPTQKVIYEKGLMDTLIAQKKYEDAAKLVDEILKQAPDDQHVLSTKAALMLQRGDTEDVKKAVAEFNALVQKAPGDPVLRYKLGRAYQTAGDLGNAWIQYREALRRRSGYVAPRRGLMELNLATGRFRDALRYADELIAQGAGDTAVRARRAASLAGLGKYDEARTELTNVLKDAPGDADAQLQLGLVYIMQKKLPEAQAIFQRLHESMRDDLRPLQGLVRTYILGTQADAALQVLNNELKRKPNSSELRLLLGDTASSFGKYDLAIEQYKQVLATTPKSGDVYFRLGQVHAAKGDLETALASYQKAASLNQKDARAWAFLASTSQEAGKVEDAKANYRKALELRPGHPALLNNLAYLIADTGGNLDEALKYAQDCLRTQPDSPDFADTMGLVLLKKGSTDSALRIFGGLTKKFPDNPSFRYHFAMVLLQTGAKEKARTELNATVNLKRSKEEERKIQDLMRAIG